MLYISITTWALRHVLNPTALMTCALLLAVERIPLTQWALYFLKIQTPSRQKQMLEI
jgi:hypothetical protein